MGWVDAAEIMEADERPAPRAVTDERFMQVWRFHDGATVPIAKHLHIGDRRVRETARRLGLRRAGYLTAAEAARILGVSQAQVGVWCANGLLPATHAPGYKTHWKITRQAVEEIRSQVPFIALRPYEVEPGCVTSDDLARRIGYSRDYVQHGCRKGLIAAHKSPRGDWRIRIEEADRVARQLAETGRLTSGGTVTLFRPREVRMEPFHSLLKGFIERSGRSRNQIAELAGIAPSMLLRATRGERGMSEQSINAVARALGLADVDHNRLLVAAGLAPRQLRVLGGWDETFEAVAAAMLLLPAAERRAFAWEIRSVADRFRRVEA